MCTVRILLSFLAWPHASRALEIGGGADCMGDNEAETQGGRVRYRRMMGDTEEGRHRSVSTRRNVFTTEHEMRYSRFNHPRRHVHPIQGI